MSSKPDDLKTQNLAEGDYAKKQLFTRSPIINWSHGARFRLAVELAAMFAGKRILDYGSGDGTFLSMLADGPAPPASAVGAEIDPRQVDDSRARHPDPRLAFVGIPDLADEKYTHTFDGLVCMEVLEHVVELPTILDSWHRLLKPDGRLLISVPVETGPVLAAKQVIRRIAGWRGIGDYPGMDPYTWSELTRSLFAGSRQQFVRPIHASSDGTSHYCHKGFNWRAMRAELSKRFILERQLSSPFRFLPPGCGSQAWFVLRNPPDGA